MAATIPGNQLINVTITAYLKSTISLSSMNFLYNCQLTQKFDPTSPTKIGISTNRIFNTTNPNSPRSGALLFGGFSVDIFISRDKY